MGRWLRGVTDYECPQRCRLIDNGTVVDLIEANEESGIYILENQFLSLPPRAILTGLAFIVPTSPKGTRWTCRAAEIFHMITTNRNIKCAFSQRGLFDNSVYVFLCSADKESRGGMIHVNTMLVAFDAAIPTLTELHHPIWPTDSLC